VSNSLSNFKKNFLDRSTVLRGVLQSQGPTLFTQILQQRSMEAKPQPKQPVSYRAMVKQWASKPVSAQLVGLREKLRDVRSRLEDEALVPAVIAWSDFARNPDKKREMFEIALSALGTYGGTVMGMGLPSVDIRFFSSDTPDQTVVFHSAPRLFTRVTLEWLERVFALAALSPSLSREDQKFFEGLEKLTHGLQRGVQAGTFVRDEVWRSLPGLRSIVHSEQPLPVDAYSLKMASLWVTEMLRAAARKEPK
jgi:hypothetical protein